MAAPNRSTPLPPSRCCCCCCSCCCCCWWSFWSCLPPYQKYRLWGKNCVKNGSFLLFFFFWPSPPNEFRAGAHVGGKEGEIFFSHFHIFPAFYWAFLGVTMRHLIIWLFFVLYARRIQVLCFNFVKIPFNSRKSPIICKFAKNVSITVSFFLQNL